MPFDLSRGIIAIGVTFDFYIGPAGADGNAGTLASPWAITSLKSGNSNQSLMAGKRIGIMDGTYDVSGYPTNHQVPLLHVPAGSAGTPTIVGAVNPRMAIITAKSGGGVYNNSPIIGQSQEPGYFTVDGLKLTGSAQYAVYTYGAAGGTQYTTGVTVKNCEIYDLSRLHAMSDSAPPDTDNVSGVNVQGVSGMLIQNCYFHDIYNGSSGTEGNSAGDNNASGVELWGSANTTVEYCTFVNMYGGVHDKTAIFPIPNYGTEVRFCYFQNIANVQVSGSGTMIFPGFDNAGATYTGGVPHKIHHNIVYTPSGNLLTYFMKADIFDGVHFQSPWQIYNNTVIWGNLGNGGVLGEPIVSGGQTASLSYYNNIHYRQGTVGFYKDINVPATIGNGGISVLDFNCYFVSGGSPQFSKGSGPGATYSGLAAYQTALAAYAGTNQKELNSLSSDPLLVSLTGSTPASYKLQGGSPCVSAAKVGGVDAGSVIDMGAWGYDPVLAAVPARIGINF